MLFHQNKEGANMEKGQFDSKSIANVYKLLEDILNTFKTKWMGKQFMSFKSIHVLLPKKVRVRFRGLP